jgi:acyl carrier protein
MQVERSEILGLILQTARRVVAEMDGDRRFEINEESELMGGRHGFDSLALLTFVMELEEVLHARFGRTVRLGDEKALSEPVVPFKDVPRLTRYVETLLTTEANA